MVYANPVSNTLAANQSLTGKASMFSGKTQMNFSNSPFAIPMPSDVSSPTSTSIATLPVNNPASNSKLSPVYQGEKTEPTGNNSREYVIRSPRLAPSAVVSENIVLAKLSLKLTA